MQDVSFFDKTRSGEIVSRLTSDIQDFKSSFKIGISQGLRSFTQIIGCIISVIAISPELATVVVFNLPTIILVGTLLGRSLRKLSMEAQNQVAKSTAVCDEAIQNIRTYLDIPPSPMMTGGDIIIDQSMAGDIVFKNVKFSYPTRSDHVILKDFNLHIPAGKTVAIVGTSGNGKSTVAALLERFYDVDEGSITIDGRDIKSLNSSYLRGSVLGFINQEPTLFATSIMENIRYGKQDATDEEVVEAAKEANAHDFIIKFPDGYATEVGERGAQLSGGQKQRVAIARALLKQPSVLILDEATSALDYESERVVQKAIENVTKGRTVLVIAHRLSTIKGADIIVVLQRGVIAEIGSHSELIDRKGVYYTLVNEQEKENM
ncbi:ATP-binding cassette sub-family B member 8, mitochondrial [Harpegnathos saltator]|uniref:Mitochondrial potassium channel ATP-binding subunit n=1 Tax=Harpegnathos saltator TaxID=610380 RepID=E2B679_HARSA|nr:ATP-binding cassette sub-family B member 8, mitochondrial [Harpegnathos saltator]